MRRILLPLAMFAVASLFYCYEFMLRVTPGAIFSDLMQAFSIDATSLGLLSSLYFLSYAVLQLPVGIWMDRFGPRRLLTFAIILCAASTILFAQTTSYFLACAARLLIGAGSAFAFISCMKIVTLWFPARYFASLAGLTLTIGTLGAVFGESPLALALEWTDWRTLLVWIGFFGIGLGVLSWLFVRDENQAAKQVDSAQSAPVGFWVCLKAVCRQPHNWWIAAYAFLTTGPTDAFGGMWGIPFLVHVHGLEEASAATAVSMTFFGLACGSPFFGWMSDSIKSRRRPMWIAAAGATLSLTMIIYLPVLSFVQAMVLFFAFGFFGMYVLSFVTARDVNPPEYVGTMVGFVNMASMVGSMLMMYLVGLCLDLLHTPTNEAIVTYTAADYRSSLALFPIAYALCVVLVIPKMIETFPNNNKAAQQPA